MTMLALREVVLGEREFSLIRRLVYEHCGINLCDDKKELVRARLAKRLRLGCFATFGDYVRHVLEDTTGQELSLLVDSLSTNLTKFFREEQHFEFLRTRLLPDLLKSRRYGYERRIRAWSAGCSSGEEPYSIAITLLEAVHDAGHWDVKILATDISTRMLELARRGIYDPGRVEPIPLSFRHKYLVRAPGVDAEAYQVGDSLRRIVIFRYLNLMKNWPIKTPLDFIFCRNVMIYFDKPTQARLIQRFCDLLAPGGVLFTGHSESLTGIPHRLRYVQPTIYMKP
jgi:chemotaxis protein methyltransferase CheR